MASVVNASQLSAGQIETLEKISMRLVYQAIHDFAGEAVYIFTNSPHGDETEVAEDITREALGRLPGFPVGERIFGTMDFKRAGYVFAPDYTARQALLVDSKAEKTRGVARLQTSQTSLRIRQIRAGQEVDIQGDLATEMCLRDEMYLVTTIFVHYHYREINHCKELRNITIAALPNGKLSSVYVPSATDTIFTAGPNAPTLGEAFRTRLSFSRLRNRCRWRVQHISLQPNAVMVPDSWEE